MGINFTCCTKGPFTFYLFSFYFIFTLTNFFVVSEVRTSNLFYYALFLLTEAHADIFTSTNKHKTLFSSSSFCNFILKTHLTFSKNIVDNLHTLAQ